MTVSDILLRSKFSSLPSKTKTGNLINAIQNSMINKFNLSSFLFTSPSSTPAHNYSATLDTRHLTETRTNVRQHKSPGCEIHKFSCTLIMTFSAVQTRGRIHCVRMRSCAARFSVFQK